MEVERAINMETIDNLKAEIETLRKENICLKRMIDEKDAKTETARAQMAELERMVQYYKGQIEAYQYCMNCRH